MLLAAAVVVIGVQRMDAECEEQAAATNDLDALGFGIAKANGINEALNEGLLVGLDDALGLLLGVLGIVDFGFRGFSGIAHKGNAFLKVSHFSNLLCIKQK